MLNMRLGNWSVSYWGAGQGMAHPEYCTDYCRRNRKANGGGYNYISPFWRLVLKISRYSKVEQQYWEESETNPLKPESCQDLQIFYLKFTWDLVLDLRDRLIETITDGPTKRELDLVTAWSHLCAQFCLGCLILSDVLRLLCQNNKGGSTNGGELKVK